MSSLHVLPTSRVAFLRVLRFPLVVQKHAKNVFGMNFCAHEAHYMDRFTVMNVTEVKHNVHIQTNKQYAAITAFKLVLKPCRIE